MCIYLYKYINKVFYGVPVHLFVYRVASENLHMQTTAISYPLVRKSIKCVLDV